MGDIADQLGAVLAARSAALPAVRAEIAKWRRVDAAVAALAAAVTELRQHPATPPPAAAHLDRLPIADLRPAVTAAIEPLQQVERRIGRGRLCIGVGGAGRGGKSTLVQSISGLSDAELPTGAVGPVTAVRTRVVHVPGRRRAVVAPHTVDSFRAAHMGGRPMPAEPAEQPANASKRGRLDRIRAALWSYEGLLDRHGRPLELTGDDLGRLREYVAHPPRERRTGRLPVAHRYLAVREARIECAFPHSDAGAIEILDLPGLDGTAGTGRHHVAGLRHDVDLVLQVKRAAGTVRWDGSDDVALALLDEARGFVGRREDFVVVVLNTQTAADPAAGRLDRRGTMHRLRVLSVDGRDPADVTARLLRPVLRHLAERLPAMDTEVFAGTRALTGALRDQLIDLAVTTKVVVGQVCGPAAGVAVDLYRRADELHTGVEAALRAVLTRARDGAGDGDPELAAAARRAHAEILSWTRNGLGVGYDRWCAAARRGLRRGGGAGAFVRAELDRVRAEIDRRYRALDEILRQRLAGVWTDVAHAMAPLLGEATGPGGTAGPGEAAGAAALARLGELAADAARPCPSLQAAAADLLSVRLDYRTHIWPRIRPELAALEQRVLATPAAHDRVDELHRAIADQAELAAARVLARLLTEAELPGWVLLTAVERFADTVLDATTPEREIRQLARSYRHDLWPGVYRGLDRDDARVVRIARAADELLAATTELATTGS